MPNMDFFRRPLLAGKNITRMTLATVRGSIRRLEADGTVAFPYFAGAAAAQTLNIKVDEVAYLVTITGAGITTILANINAVLLTNGVAFDADGTIGIRTVTGGPTGSVEITGGTAGPFLGLDVANGRIRAVNGDIPSSTEGRVGNWQGVSFPNRGENFNTESVTRGLARLSANADVLYSDDSRSDAVVQKLTFATGDQRLLTISTTSSRLFTGFGLLTAASTKEDLSPYFHMIDTATKQIAKSRVIAVARGTVVGLPPYANATTWIGGGAIGNVLGVDLVKVPSVAITDIRNGRIIQSTGADFTDVVPGDFVNITGATNTNQWTNNGYKWVVEEVISTTVLAVRPMSKSELILMGTTLNNEQPTLELNTAKSGGEVFGNIIVQTGSFCTNVNVIVDPPIPVGATYELWAAVGGSVRSNAPSTLRNALSPIYRDQVSDYNLVENGSLGGFVASQVGANCQVTAGIFRLHGRVFSLPARTFLPGEFANGTNYLYWDELTGNYGITLLTTPWASVLNPGVGTNKGHLVAEVVLAAGVITSVIPITKVRGENSVSVTIGVGGQFSTIEAAILWAQALVDNYTETASASGSYPHFEFVIVSDITPTSLLPFGTIPSVTIRGANESVKLNMAANYFQVKGKRFEVRDLQITTSVDSNYLVRVVGVAATEKVLVKNVRQTSGNLWSVIETTGTGVLSEAQVIDCDIRLSRNVVRGTGTGGRGVDKIRIEDSRFVNVASGIPHLIEHTTIGTAWDGVSLVIKDCDFTGAWGGVVASGDSNPLIVKETGAGAGSYILLKNIHIGLGGYVSVDAASMVACVNECLVENVQVTAGKIPIAVAGTSLATVLNSSFKVNPSGATTTAITAGVIRGCALAHQGTDAAQPKAAIGLKPSIEATLNVLSGPWYRAISTGGSSNLAISHNKVNIQSAGSSAEEGQAGVYVVGGGSNIKILNNTITIEYNAVTGIVYCVEFAVTAVSGIVISGNSFGIGRSGSLVGGIGTHTDVTISNNTGYVYQDNGDAHIGSAFDIRNFNRCTVANNDVRLIGINAACSFYGVQLANNYPVVITGNYFEITGIPFDGGAFGSEQWVITGNTFTVATTVTGFSQGFAGLTSGNRFHSLVGTHSLFGVLGLFRNNYVFGDVNLASGLGNSEFTDNFISGEIDGTTSTPTFNSVKFSNNFILNGLSMVSSGSVGSVVVDGNKVGGATNFNLGGGTFIAVTNDFGGAFTVLEGGGSTTVVEFSSNSVIGNASLTGTHVKAHGNSITLDLTVAEAFNTTHGSVVGNSIGRDLFTFSDVMTVSGNNIIQNFSHTRSSGLLSRVYFTNNSIQGNFDCNDLSINDYRVEHLVIEGNSFKGAATLTLEAKATNLFVNNNIFNPSNGFAPIFGGLNICATNNQMWSTAFSVGSNQGTIITFTHTVGVNRVWCERNWIYGRVDLTIGQADLWFNNNYVYNFSNNSATVACGSIGNSAIISNNMLRQDLNSIASDGQTGNINFSGNTQGVRIIGNGLTCGPLSAAYTGITTFAQIAMAGASNVQFVINDNIFNKSNNATISTFLITLDYIRLLNATAGVVNGNLGLSGGTVGATVKQGQLAYHAGAGTYTLAE